MKKLTWSDIEGTILDCTLGRFMDYVEEDTGKFPDWDDEIPADSPYYTSGRG